MSCTPRSDPASFTRTPTCPASTRVSDSHPTHPSTRIATTTYKTRRSPPRSGPPRPMTTLSAMRGVLHGTRRRVESPPPHEDREDEHVRGGHDRDGDDAEREPAIARCVEKRLQK